ncbi:cell envelope biogenesis protein OmpA [Bacteroidia bacterium]|nr:cell envelope biogenesis protein OmpA [Bacteroidia bacterium]
MKQSLKILIIFTLCVMAVVCKAQKAVEKADHAFQLQQYNFAITLYQKAFSKIKKTDAIGKNRVNYQIAECYRLSGQYHKALGIYRNVAKARYYEVEPKVYFYLGEIYRFEGNYTEAIKQYELYLALKPEDEVALQALRASESVDQWLKNPSRYQVENIKKINSKANDWAPRYLGANEKILTFTSAREGTTGKKLDDWTGERFTDIFIAEKDPKGNWSTPVLIDNEAILNTITNESDAFFINSGNTVFFTLCTGGKGTESRCLIHTSTFNGASWSAPTLVPLSEDTLSDCVHPWVSEDALRIFFTSNMQGGEGDLDIWYAERSAADAPFGQAINCGTAINTLGKEGWPFLRNDTALYFASNGHIGLGGLDLFKSSRDTDGQWQTSENMQVPVNSSADDFGIIFAKNGEEGFFTSNRSGGRGGDDTWSFSLPSIRFSISGVVRNDDNMQLMSQVLIQIVGSDGLTLQTFTNNKGFYRFDESQIQQNVTYKLWATKSEFLDNEAIETTVGLNNSKDLVRDFRMKPQPKGAVVLPDILYDVAKWDLKEQYQDSLIGLIELLEKNPRLVVELASHTDSRPIAMTNDSLSQYRAQEVVNYLILRGIHPQRLVAKGYGARQPRKYYQETTLSDGTNTLVVPQDSSLTESFVSTLPREQQELAHQANRRTEFSILRDDFIPPVDSDNNNLSLENIVQQASSETDNQISYIINPNGMPELPVIVNGTSFTFTYDAKGKINYIGNQDAMNLLQIGKINKNDFQNKEKAFDEDGNIVVKSILTLRELKIGKAVLRDVQVVVITELPAPLQLCTETLKALGTFTLDTENKMLKIQK